MKTRDVVIIVVALVAVVKLDFFLTLSYWNAFQLGVKIVVFLLPIVVAFIVLKWLYDKKKKTRKPKGNTRKAKRK